MKDFTEPGKKIEFKIDDDVFYGVSDLPAFSVLDFSAALDAPELITQDPAKAAQMFTDLIKMVLEPDSAELMFARMRNSGKPIGIGTIKQLIPWLLEQYGLRPTQPSEESSGGSENQEYGMNLTVNLPDEESISESSLSTDS